MTTDATREFRFQYDPPAIRYGAGAVADLAAELAQHGLERALVVTGSTVGSTPAVMTPVREGLGDRLAGTFAETTPDKRLSTAVDGRDAVAETDADCLVALGGGSSLDVAKAVAVLAGDERDPGDVGSAFQEMQTLSPASEPLPIVAVPTTLAGADLSLMAGLTADPREGLVDEHVGGGLFNPGLMPAAAVYDPELFATTPPDVLAGSAMNGFDKGLESLYARTRTPVTDATAMRGLSLLVEALPRMGETGPDPEVLAPVVEGVVLVQYGINRAEGTTMSLIHALGHGLTAFGSVQQGAAHAVVAPHALRYLFGEVDGRRDLLAEALGVDDQPDPAEAVVGAVAEVRDALGLSSRLRDVDGPGQEEFHDVAEYVRNDSFMGNAPTGLEPSLGDLERVLERAH
jgi:alcohol dehydrogenase class IV